jgi:hypothetical protein
VRLAINTIMPNDLLVLGHTLDELIPQEPAGAGALGFASGHAGWVLGASALGR